MTAARKTPTDPQRKAALAKVHAGAKALGLDEGARRDVIARATGRRSAADCTLDQLDAVVTEMRRLGWQPAERKQPKRAGKRKLASGEVQGKARALWLDLYHLGEVRSPEEAALDAFVKRQVKVDSLRFLTPQQAEKVIEALKDWCARAGVDWSPRPTDPPEGDPPAGLPVKARVIAAQWARLHALGAVRIADEGALSAWLAGAGQITPGLRATEHLSDAQADAAIEKLGRWIRKTQARRKG